MHDMIKWYFTKTVVKSSKITELFEVWISYIEMNMKTGLFLECDRHHCNSRMKMISAHVTKKLNKGEKNVQKKSGYDAWVWTFSV